MQRRHKSISKAGNPDTVLPSAMFLVTPALAAILRTTDGGKTWKDISGAASHYTYTWLSLSGADPSDILVGTAGGGAYIGHDNDVLGTNNANASSLFSGR